MVDVVSTRTLRFFSIFHPVSSQQVVVLGLFYCRYKTLHFPLLNFRRSLLAHFSSLSRSLWRISHSPQFCLISKLAEGTLRPIILIIYNRIVHSITPLDTLLATGLQDDFAAQISTPWPYLYR